MKTEKEIQKLINERVSRRDLIQSELDRIKKVWEGRDEFALGERVKCQVEEIKDLFEDGTLRAQRRVFRLQSEIDLLTEILK